VHDGLEDGLTKEQLNDDENLVTLCEACNIGQGARSLSARFYLVILLRRALQRIRGAA
jgi:hypothetical protein